jgi:hypothetical protein
MSKTEVEWTNRIEIWWLLRDMKGRIWKDGSIQWGDNGDRGRISYQLSLSDDSPYLRLYYTHTSWGDEKTDVDYKIYLVKTPCHFGGYRYWFKCGLYKNGVYCGRRVGVVYLDGKFFGCRHCHDLTYSSRNVNTRHALHPLFRTLDIEMKLEKLYPKVKRRTYKGRFTKKQRKLNALLQQSEKLS